MNPVAELNQFCHKNRLGFNFKLIKADGPAHDKIFDVCLYIHNLCSEKKRCLEFNGTGKSIKAANIQAANDALNKDLLKIFEELENQVDYKKDLDLSHDSNFSTNMIIDESFESNCLKNKFSDLYSMAEKSNLFLDIDFVWFQENEKKFNSMLTIGSQKYPGSGSTDIEAIYDAVNSVKIDYIIDKKGHLNFEQELTQNYLAEINIRSQRLKSNLEFNCLAQVGIPQLKFVIYKCIFGQNVAYGLGKNKKIAKNRAAKKIIDLIESDNFLNIMKLETLGIQEKMKKEINEKEFHNILYSGLDAISILHVLDSNRRSPSLEFVYKKDQVYQNPYFTVDCFLEYEQDFKNITINKENVIIKNNCYFLKTTSSNTKKKKAKMEAAEKMVHLLQGKPPMIQESLENFNYQPVKKFDLK